MSKRTVSGIMLTLLLMSMLTLAFNIQPAKAGTIIVPDNYPTIQEAINAANLGDTVSVKNGTYWEHVVVNKSISLIGENKENTIIDGSRNGTVISVTADYVSISGLTIQNGYHIPHITYGIKVGEWEDGCNNVTVHDNIISDNDMGIFVYYSSNSIVFDNLVFNNYRGIDIVLSNDNYIDGNSLFNNEVGVIIGSDANSNMIHNNEIYNNGFCGISVGWSTHNKIVGNMLSCNSEAGIRLDASNNNNIIGNHIASNRRDGIVLFGSNSNTVTGNGLIQNEWDGIALWYSNSNSIYHNNFLDNTKQAGSYSGSINIWDYGYPLGGNFWSDYSGVDDNGDGIGDTPYVIDVDDQDNYPLMSQWGPVRNTNTGLHYQTIQAAINAPETLDGHTIFVEAGTYHEHLVVNKSVSLIGENRDTTIIDGNETGSVVHVTTGNVNISDFTIQDSGTVGEWSLSGILVDHSSDNNISHNLLTNNYKGILLDYSSNNTFTGNNVTDNLSNGFFLYYSSNNVLTGNTISNNGISGISLGYSSNNVLTDNVISNNAVYGIRFAVSSNNTLTGNDISDHDIGISLEYSSNNVFTGNSISKNKANGIKLAESSNNAIFHNNFINNIQQVYDVSWDYPVFSPSTNVWDNGYPSGGNYWNDYTGVDVKSGPNQDQPNGDGIGDIAYVIDGNNRDNYPLIEPWSRAHTHQLTVTSSPITGIPFTINGTPQTTPYTEWLLEGSYTLIMPETHNGYVWSLWLEDGDPNRTKTLTLPGTTWTGVFVFAAQPHGPEAEFEAIPDTASTGESIKFDASASLPGWNGTHEMPITEYRWDFGSGIKITTSTPILYYGFISPGTCYATLAVYAPGATPETDTISHKATIISVPVGGYSIPIKGYTTEKPLTLYLALIGILTASFTIAKRRKKQQN